MVLVLQGDLLIELICPQGGVCLHGHQAQKQGYQQGCEAHQEGLQALDHRWSYRRGERGLGSRKGLATKAEQTS